MPIMRTPPPDNSPGHYGEYELYLKLSELPIDNLELWFNLEFPTVPEIDLIINLPDVGAYIVEVKAMRIHEIVSYTPDHIERADGKHGQHPVKQVKRAEISLRNYLDRHRGNLRVPFIQKTVLWPRITREEWRNRFTNPVVDDQTWGMIFADDLVDENEFLSALKTVTENPLGVQVPQAVRCDQPGIQILRQLVDYDGSSLESTIAAEPDILTAQEKKELSAATLKSQSRISKYPANERHRVAFRGFPGSGKTTALRDLAVEHAGAGNSVLYVCFNKVLAAKVRQEIDAMLTARGIKDALVSVSDEYQLYSSMFPGIDLWEKEKIPERAKNIAEVSDVLTFETILIDEAQDINGELLEVLELVTSETTSIFFAYGDGQQLYNLDRYENGLSPQLERLIRESETSQFNRVFRNSPTNQLVCAAVADRYPNTNNAIEWLSAQAAKRASTAEPGVMTLEFEDYEYEPTIVVVDQDDTVSPKQFLIQLVNNLIQGSTNEHREVNGLIIVGGFASKNLQVITAYLDMLEIPYANLIKDGNKRNPPTKEELVISTYQGARGLTSQHTLVLDSDYIEGNYNHPSKPTKNNVFNIALSRARGTTVIYSGTTQDDPKRPQLASFVEAALTSLK